MARKLRLRVRPGTALLVASTEKGEGGQYSAGDEIVLLLSDAAALLSGKGRRGVEIVQVIDDPQTPPKRTLP